MNKVKRFTDELDHNIRGGRERAGIIGDLLYEDGEINKIVNDYFDNEFEDGFDDEFNKGILSHEDDTCIELERMANYILNGGDSEHVMVDYHIQSKRDGRNIL